MSKLIGKLFTFLFLFCISSSSIFAAQPGLNLINSIKSKSYVPQNETFDWVVYTPESPDQLNSVSFDVNNVVLRLHSAWTDTGKLMLGIPGQQQQIASDWCQAINTLASTGKKIFVEPFNELEHDYERLTPQGGIGLNPAILRANIFITNLRSCLASPTVVISPAMDPQSADFPTTSQAFSGFDIISCHPYRNDTINRCTSGPLAGKQYLFTEIGVDKNGAQYDNCLFIQQFCQENFIENLNNSSGLIAYFLFTFSPGNFAGSWQLTSSQVVSALKGQCSDDLILNCDEGIDEAIDNIVQSIKNKPDPGKVAPVPDRGINKGPLGYGDEGFIQSLINNIVSALFNRNTSNRYPFNQKDTDQYIEDPFIQSGDLPNMVKVYQPPATITDQVNTLVQTDSINLLGIHDSTVDGYTSKEYSQTINYAGPGWMYSVYSPHYDFALDKETPKRAFFNLESGVSPRQTPYDSLNDDEVDNVLCQLAASADPTNPRFETHPEKRLFDEVLGYLSPNREQDFVYNLPLGSSNQGPGIVDRTHTKLGDDPVPVRISTLFCTNKNLSSFLAKCSTKGYGSISPGVCAGTPDWLKNPNLEGAYFAVFYPRLRQKALILTQNASAKGFLERCQEQDLIQCDSSNTTKYYKVYSSDFGDLDPDTRTKILDVDKGAYAKLKSGNCYACRTTIIFFPNLTQANQVIKQTGDMSTPYSSHETLKNTPQSVNYSGIDKEAQVNYADTASPLGMGNLHEQIETNTLTLSERLRAVLNRSVPAGCHLVTINDPDGNPVSKNVCAGEKKSKLETILYLSPQAYQYINRSSNFYNYLTPYTVQRKLETSIKKASNNSPQLINTTSSTYVTGNNYGGLMGDEELARTNTTNSGRQLVDDSANKVMFAPNLAAQQQIQQLMFTPYKWQKEMSKLDASNDYRPKTNQPLSPDFNPSVLDFCDSIRQAALAKNIDPSLIAALISIESAGNPSAISSQGAVGLMQVMPNDAKDKDGKPLYFDCGGHDCFVNRPPTQQLLDPNFNIRYGVQLLSSMVTYWGNIEAGLTHYGPLGYDGYAALVFGVQSQNPTACSP